MLLSRPATEDISGNIVKTHCNASLDATERKPSLQAKASLKTAKASLKTENTTTKILEAWATKAHKHKQNNPAETQRIASLPTDDADAFSALTTHTSTALTKAVLEGYGDIESKRDQIVETQLTTSLQLFSGFKTYETLRLATDLLLDVNGALKPLQSFIKDIKILDQTYNSAYLTAEYNQAVASAQMASVWADYSQNADLFDLEYVAVNDDRTRASHAALHGIIRPMDDAFWNSFYPPNGWGCRCYVRQVRKTDNKAGAQVAPETLEIMRKSLGIFDTNTAKAGVVFPAKHPYYARNKAVNKNLIIYHSYPAAYTKEYFNEKTGGFVVRHELHTDKKWKEHIMIAKIIIQKESAIIELLPRSNETSPDCSYNGIKADFKAPKDAKKLKNFVKRGIEKAHAQGDIAILYLPKDYDYEGLVEGFLKHIEFKEKDNSAIENVIVVTESGYIAKIHNSDFNDDSWVEKIQLLKR